MARIGMRHLVFAPITAEANNTVTYGTGLVIGRAVRGAVTINRYDAKLYGDDALAEAYNGVKDLSLEIETTELEEANAATMGILKATTSGSDTTYSITDDPGVYGGCGWVQVVQRKGVVKYKAIWVYKTCLGNGSDESATKGDSLTFGTNTLSGAGLAVQVDSTGTNHYMKEQVFDTLSAAVAYLDGLANI